MAIEAESTVGASAPDAGVFPFARWTPRLEELAARYRAAAPFPSIGLPDFLDAPTALALAREFPRPDDPAWIQYKHYNENKQGTSDRARFPPLIGRAIDAFNAPEFVAWVSALTGIPGLEADPALAGGGMHQTESQGYLHVHADFTHHPYRHELRRRVNLILYVNEGWDPAWGGAIELWNRSMAGCEARFPPLLNHAVVFSTTEHSYHGYPDPIACPPTVTRNSLALYYYTREDAARTPVRSTRYQARPGDRALPIWIDNVLLATYSRVKRTLGLRDDFAGKVLGWFDRKKRR